MNKKKRIIIFAKRNLGKPYKFDAKPSEAPKCFDCSSFVQYLYKKVGVNLPRTALDQASKGKKVTDLSKLEVGDLLFFKGGWGHYNPQFPMGVGHVAIYIGNGRVINSRSKEKDGKEIGKVIEEPVEAFLDRKDFVVVRRII